MDQFEKNIKNSFQLVKSDIERLQETIALLVKNQELLVQEIKKLQTKKLIKKKKVIVRKQTKKAFYIASKEGNYVHAANSIHAKRIKPKNSIIFKTIKSALKKGYKLGASISR